MQLLSGRGAVRFCMLVLFLSGIAGWSHAASVAGFPADAAAAPGPADLPAVEVGGMQIDGVDESVAEAFRPKLRELTSVSITDSLNGFDPPYSNPTGAPRATNPPTAIPLPAPIFLGLTGFAFMVSVKFVKRFFF